MIASVRRRRGALLYLACCCSCLLVYFFNSISKYGRTPNARGFQVYPWQMIGYDEYDCGCPRSGPPIISESQQSLCSDWSTSRGIDQRVVSYTLYGNANDTNVHRKYYASLEDRLKEVEQFYKGFVVRLYHNLTTSNRKNKDFLCRLYCNYPFFDPCQVKTLYHRVNGHSKTTSNSTDLVSDSVVDFNALKKETSKNTSRKELLPLKAFLDSITTLSPLNAGPTTYNNLLVGKMWRFLVMADPLVSEFLVRDVDSSILEREVAAVEQWRYNSTALLHAMRDHPSHNGLILAGLWGGSRTRGGDKLSDLLWQMMRWPPRDLWDYDQILLKRVVWPEVTDDVLVHDSYFCGNPRFQSKHRSEPFPTRRKERYFVGWGPTRNPEMNGITRCPRQCRPVNHQDWVLC